MTLVALLLAATLTPQAELPEMAPGSMWITRSEGQTAMPMTLTHTEVHARIAGFGARVTVQQTFNNPSTTPIEAVYTFPLPDKAAVDKMSMHIGRRSILGVIKERDEARRIYETAKSNGQAASLLDQERPNIFTQSVANIMPGQQIQVEISYVELLKYSDSEFEFSFPMVVGPRYLGGDVKDPSKIAPPIIGPRSRTGQSISLGVDIDAGAPIEAIDSVLHPINVDRSGENTAHVELRRADEIPNRDFILKYRVATDSVQSAFVSSYDPEKGGQFALVVMPPKRPAPTQISPREIIFVIDRSGSQKGFPIEKSKELTLKLMRTLRAGDTFNMISFGMTCTTLWTRPQPYSESSEAEAQSFIRSIQADGGTNVESGITAALRAQNDSSRTRIVLLNTDGFIGNEGSVINAIHEGKGAARVFTFGIGNSVNRYIIDAMASEGRGEAEYVTLADKAEPAVERLTKRLETPVLVNVSATFSGAAVDDCTPKYIPDLFDEKPIIILGHYSTPGTTNVVLKGDVAGQPWSQSFTLHLTSEKSDSPVPTLWARERIEEIERERIVSRLCGQKEGETVEDQIKNLALNYGLVSSQTSFVAVEPRIVNIGGKATTVRVPVEMADGVSYQGIFGQQAQLQAPSHGTVVYGNTIAGLSAGAPAGGAFGSGGIGGGAGRGGFGGPGGAPAATPPSSVTKRIEIRSGDPALLKAKADSDSKIAKSLKKATGEVVVQVSLSKLDDAIISKLKEAGLTIDDKDAALKVIFGRIDAKLLKKLAAIEQVQRIDPLK